MNERLTQWIERAGDYWHRLEFGRENKLAWVAAFAAVILAAIWIYRRDACELGRFTKIWLVPRRLSVLALLLVIAMRPEIPKNKMLVNPSRVAVLVDTSLSMSITDKIAADPATPASAPVRRPRVELIQELLSQSDLI